MLLLDTTVLIDVLRGRPAAKRLLSMQAVGAVPYVCAVTADELTRGLRDGEAALAHQLLHALREAPLGVAEGEQAGRWRAAFAGRGRTLSQPDCLVAAAAHSVGARLATGNPKDFPMTEIEIEHWPAGQ